MADCHEANRVGLAVDGIDDPETANTKLSQSVEFAEQRVATFWVGGDGADREFNRSFQIRMKRADRFRDVRWDVRVKGSHAGRRFFGRLIGSPKTSSKESPFFPPR